MQISATRHSLRISTERATGFGYSFAASDVNRDASRTDGAAGGSIWRGLGEAATTFPTSPTRWGFFPPRRHFAPYYACLPTRSARAAWRATASHEARPKRRVSRYRRLDRHRSRPLRSLAVPRPRSALRRFRCRADRGQLARWQPNRRVRAFRTTPPPQQIAAGSSPLLFRPRLHWSQAAQAPDEAHSGIECRAGDCRTRAVSAVLHRCSPERPGPGEPFPTLRASGSRRRARREEARSQRDTPVLLFQYRSNSRETSRTTGPTASTSRSWNSTCRTGAVVLVTHIAAADDRGLVVRREGLVVHAAIDAREISSRN